MPRPARQARREKAVLVFGEGDSDRELLVVLGKALRPDLPKPVKLRDPLVQAHDRITAEKRKQNARDLRQAVARNSVRYDVRGVLLHEDCDATEPAHVEQAEAMRAQLDGVDIAVVAAAPAWETETWLYQWPDAAPAHVKKWRAPKRSGKHVGLLVDTKEAYAKDVQPKNGQARAYEENDAPLIVAKAIALDMLDTLDARSDSYVAFRDALLAAKF